MPSSAPRPDHLNALERTIFDSLVAASQFGAMLNEKDPPLLAPVVPPEMVEGEIVGADVREARLHPDTRIARRAATIARLAHIIAGRDVQAGLRRSLQTQADRLA